uniref:Uncharacterized protein n=1 Tax=Euplotes harpa TaxID=151035 RepID=A0A7S3JM90_9SPIT|mmetsp:Transcript_9334/g.10491  ORF Transcript_9334/g.10491 Transcript_9334/m.10491 type:complete len:143 (+) Transcript_9334:385-813(+)
MNADVDKEDVIKAIQMLGKDLRGTFRVIEGDIICCVPFGMNEDYKKVIQYFDEKFTMKDLKDKGFSKVQADNVIESMLENGMICEDAQCPASNSKSNIVEAPNTKLYWIVSKATDEEILNDNLQDIKNEDSDGEDDDEEDDD